MLQHCNGAQLLTRWGSLSAHGIAAMLVKHLSRPATDRIYLSRICLRKFVATKKFTSDKGDIGATGLGKREQVL